MPGASLDGQYVQLAPSEDCGLQFFLIVFPFHVQLWNPKARGLMGPNLLRKHRWQFLFSIYESKDDRLTGAKRREFSGMIHNNYES